MAILWKAFIYSYFIFIERGDIMKNDILFEINGERFVPIKDFDGYAIGDNGTILSTHQSKGKEWRRMVPYKGKTSEYLCIYIKRNDGKYKHCLISRLVALHFVDGYFDNAVVGHKDTNIYNNHYTNLKWMTQLENIHQSYEDSGMGAKRNYKCYQVCKNGQVVSPILEGNTEVKNFLAEYDNKVSYTSLMKYRKTKDYTLIVSDKNK